MTRPAVRGGRNAAGRRGMLRWTKRVTGGSCHDPTAGVNDVRAMTVHGVRIAHAWSGRAVRDAPSRAGGACDIGRRPARAAGTRRTRAPRTLRAMPGLYLAAIVGSFAGLALLDRRFRLGLASRATLAAIVVVEVAFLAFDLLGASRGWFATNTDWVDRLLAAGHPARGAPAPRLHRDVVDRALPARRAAGPAKDRVIPEYTLAALRLARRRRSCSPGRPGSCAAAARGSRFGAFLAFTVVFDAVLTGLPIVDVRRPPTCAGSAWGRRRWRTTSTGQALCLTAIATYEIARRRWRSAARRPATPVPAMSALRTVLAASRPISWVNTALPFLAAAYEVERGLTPLLVLGLRLLPGARSTC